MEISVYVVHACHILNAIKRYYREINTISGSQKRMRENSDIVASRGENKDVSHSGGT